MIDTEELKTKIKTFLENKGLELESQYFLLLQLTEEIKEEIFDFSDDDDEDEEPEELDDFSDDDDEDEELEELEKPIKSKDHNSGIKKILKGNIVKKPKVKINNDLD